MKSSNTKKFAVGAIVAGVVGYVAGILTAPKSGKETRADIKKTAVSSFAEAEKQLKKLHTQLGEMIAEAKTEASKLSGKARDEVDKVINRAKDAKESARELLSATHEGVADD